MFFLPGKDESAHSSSDAGVEPNPADCILWYNQIKQGFWSSSWPPFPPQCTVCRSMSSENTAPAYLIDAVKYGVQLGDPCAVSSRADGIGQADQPKLRVPVVKEHKIPEG